MSEKVENEETTETINLGPDDSALVFNKDGAFRMCLASPIDSDDANVPHSAMVAVYCAAFLKRPDLIKQVAEDIHTQIEEEAGDGGEG